MFEPIENYGLVGNLETCALVSRQGSVDWFPVPHLESPSVFSRILDDGGGCFAVEPVGDFESTQRYRERTNVLETTFRTEEGTLRLTDFMAPLTDDESEVPARTLYRKLDCLAGRVDFRAVFEPRFDFARTEPTLSTTTEGIHATGDETPLCCWSTLPEPFEIDTEASRATASATLSAGQQTSIGVSYGELIAPDPATCEQALVETVDYWREWSHSCDDQSECVFGGPWHALAVRSGLVLKLLTHYETGAIAAAPTTSLPEEIGGVRNWDYRFNWIRDAAFTVQALSNLGHTVEASEYLSWFLDLCRTTTPAELQPLYGLHGESGLTERILHHLSGYRDSGPVRIGNEAADQRQLDIYGELLLAVFEATRSGIPLTEADWRAICEIVDYVTDVWEEPDSGIWEVRSEPMQFVFSKLMCWVALDRAIDLAEEQAFDAPLDRWRRHREKIRTAILNDGLDPTGSYFVRSFEEEDVLDAATLLIPFVGFLPFDDSRVRATIEAVDDRLTSETGLVYRYDGYDGLPGGEGTFLLCSFWLVDALALVGRVREAEARLERLIDYVNPVGLLAEEVAESTGRQLGNFPQAFSHIGLINSALHVSRAKGMAVPGTELIGIELGTGATVEAVRDSDNDHSDS
ncbi:glycoside hydrolase family 15 protein [Halohasta salina]|uniref:glycoside hydrolase family 15 protein n=1 Tax=Halohasta salina TaxID=2961621 RepID=UPI0020A523F6|nr:glycoside hydrolase family 15 protein [Halohasta salina]